MGSLSQAYGQSVLLKFVESLDRAQRQIASRLALQIHDLIPWLVIAHEEEADIARRSLIWAVEQSLRSNHLLWFLLWSEAVSQIQTLRFRGNWIWPHASS